MAGSWQQEDDARDRGGLNRQAAIADWHGRAGPRGTITRAVITERIDAFPREFDAHLVGEQGHPHKEVGGRHERVEQRAVRVAVALEIPVLEVKRLVAVAGSLPGERGVGKPPRLERLSLEPAFAGIVIAGTTADADVEVDIRQPVFPQFLECLAAVLVVVGAGFGHGADGDDRFGLLTRGPTVVQPPLGGCGRKGGDEGHGDRQPEGRAVTRPACAPRCSSGLLA